MPPPENFLSSVEDRLHIPLCDCAGRCIDREVILHQVVDDLAVILPAAIVKIQLELVDIGCARAGYTVQRGLLGVIEPLLLGVDLLVELGQLDGSLGESQRADRGR